MSGVRAVRRQHQDTGEKPFIVIWESIRACPLTCLHCRAEAVPSRDPRELDTAAAKELLGQVAAFGRELVELLSGPTERHGTGGALGLDHQAAAQRGTS
ncbi:hypothetical protein [Streptomyces sp. 891-h]|uniref:hypothetical protein n=1 Tax=Streptomyces sp. 891-h TaxID=2720714 RepID=UPI001FAA8B45|nr:hypothetical protein [Streptomyces sp. 891-h]